MFLFNIFRYGGSTIYLLFCIYCVCFSMDLELAMTGGVLLIALVVCIIIPLLDLLTALLGWILLLQITGIKEFSFLQDLFQTGLQ